MMKKWEDGLKNGYKVLFIDVLNTKAYNLHG
jgi:hypothetical protein